MALIDCTECGKEISDRAASCPHCGGPVTKPVKPVKVVATTYSEPKKSMALRNVILAGIALYAVHVIRNAPTPPSETSTPSGSESDAVTKCDFAAQHRVKNPSSFSSEWLWDTKTSGNRLIIKRNFTAMNGFGANIDHYYTCEYGLTTKEIMSFEIVEGSRR
jgi:DNA-directed RNA polymerase subunit RPC12/RpoP